MGKIKNRQFQVQISKLLENGNGIGTIEYPQGKVSEVEVPFTLPGESVEVEVYARKRKRYQGRLMVVKEPSEKRVKPVCLHFGSCGGCKWQHLSYEDQLKIKEESIRRKFDPFVPNNFSYFPIIACSPPWHYRNKIELSFSSDRHDNQYLGFIMGGTRGHVFQMEECHLVNPWFVQVMKAVKQWWQTEDGVDAYHSGKDVGALRTLILREGARTGDKLVVLTVSGNPAFALKKAQLERFIKIVQSVVGEENLSIFLRIQQAIKGQPTQFYEMPLFGPDHLKEKLEIEDREKNRHPLLFHVSPTAFFQPNTGQAEKLYSSALQLLDIPPGSIVYDLYCGTGTLGICAAPFAKQVYGIELSPESSLDARENVKLNGLKNVKILTGDVGKTLPQLINDNSEDPKIVIVDPPRVGLDEKAIVNILLLNPLKILYISCNPATQAANIERLIASGFEIKAIQPVDQFPQTIHVENIVVLEKRP